MMLKIRPTKMATSGLIGSLLVLATVTCMSQDGQAYRQQQQQQNQPSLKYFSDLVHSTSPIELPNPTFKSLSYGLSAQENQISDKHAAHPSLKIGPRAVINGNHATYVEPPANFKPIIYGHSQVSPNTNTNNNPQQQQQELHRNQQQQPGSFEAPTTSNGEIFQESPNHLVASMLPPISGQGLSRQQQKRQAQAAGQHLQQQQQQQQQVFNDQRVTSSEQQQQQQDSDTNATSNDESEDEPNLLPMKPSIDRWSDWHDMSVDPDLASSETQLSSASSLFHMAQSNQLPQEQQLGRPNQIPRTIYQQRRDRVQPSNFNANVMPPNQAEENFQPAINQLYQRYINQAYHQPQQRPQQQPQLDRVLELIKMQQPLDTPAASYEVKQDYFQNAQPRNFHLDHPQPQLQAAGGHEYYHSYQQRPSSSHAQAFYFVPQQQQQQQQQQQPLSPLMARSSSSFIPVGAPAMIQHHRQPPRMIPSLGQSGANNKKMANLFKAANEGQHHLALMMFSPKPVRKLNSPSADAEVKLAANQQQHQQHYFHHNHHQNNNYQLSAPLVLSSQPQEVSPGMAHSGKQVSVPGAPPAATLTASRILTPQQGGNLANPGQRLSRPSANASTAPSTNSTTTPKRVLKRRRIKTLLPVGLSSWFLGGIRDLDARHWKLPNEVMSKLAINDVDLQHLETPSLAAGAQTDDLNSTVNISNQVQAGGSLEKADQPRPSSTRSPSSQMSPR